ncbi:MAG TPA: hypothetical protein DCS13_03475 [Candidatus Margulisbacteria bacterium]|nr:MAG: hypothetical protein A2X43_03570 [Candidatus Margulisbacteria bacterium GWD2_39_127]HAR62502.1 hypothetical protein [Candidatus Margulisiibacteriota bacterium]
MNDIFFAAALVFLFCLIFVISSNSILFRFFPAYTGQHPFLKIGFSYFFGISLFLSLWRLLGLVLSARTSLFISSILLLIVVFLGIRDLKAIKIKTTGILLVILFALFSFMNIILYLPPDSASGTALVNVWDKVGSLHSPRYANLVLHIINLDRIPAINQHYGQSLLSLATSSVKMISPYIGLTIWLWVSLIFLLMTFYGAFREFKLNNFFSFLGVLVMGFGNMTLSLLPCQVIDSGNPWIGCGYTDSIVGMGTIMFFLFLTVAYLKNKISTIVYLLMLLPIIITWHMTATQNILISFPVFFMAGALILYKTRRIKDVAITAISFGFLIIFSFVTANTGGMLISSHKADHIKVPGLMQYNQKGYPTIQVKPYLRFSYFNNLFGDNAASVYAWDAKEQYSNDRLNNKTKTINNSVSYKQASVASIPIEDLIFLLEDYAWKSLRAIFYPLAGMILLFIYIFVSKIMSKKSQELEYYLLLTAVMFAAGVGVAYPFVLKGYKWELTRFMIPGGYLGMFFLVIAIVYWLDLFRIKRIYQNLIVSCIVVILIAGHAIHTGTTVRNYSKAFLTGKHHVVNTLLTQKKMIAE